MDIDYLLLLQDFRNFCGESFSTYVAYLSDATAYFTTCIALWIFWSYKKEDGIRCIFSIFFALAVSAVVKLTACVYRPWILDNRIKPPAQAFQGAGGYSFPSGHVTSATGAYGFLAYAYGKKFFFAAASVFFILLVAYSRNLLGVHTLKDVSAGLVSGTVGIVMAVSALNWADKKRNGDVVILLVSALLAATALYFISNKTYPIDYAPDGSLVVDPRKMVKSGWRDVGLFAGAVLGWFLEKRFVAFTVPKSRFVRTSRLAIGTVIYFVLSYVVSGAYLPDGMGVNVRAFLNKMIDLVVFIFVYPAVFTAFEKTFLKKFIEEEPL